MLSTNLVNQIDQLQNMFSTTDGKTPVLISAQSEELHVSAQVVDSDRLGYLLQAVKAERRAPDADMDEARIEDTIHTLLEKTTYLTEALTLVEKSRDLSRVILRSAAPDRREGGIYYYELTMEPGNSLRFSRQCYDLETRRRKAVPFVLSKEVFERFVADLAGSLAIDEPHIEPAELFSTSQSLSVQEGWS